MDLTKIVAKFREGDFVWHRGSCWVVDVRYYRRSTCAILYDLREMGAKHRPAIRRKVPEWEMVDYFGNECPAWQLKRWS